MSSLTAVGNDLYIIDNDELCQDDAEAFADSIDAGGLIYVTGNLGECD